MALRRKKETRKKKEPTIYVCLDIFFAGNSMKKKITMGRLDFYGIMTNIFVFIGRCVVQVSTGVRLASVDERKAGMEEGEEVRKDR